MRIGCHMQMILNPHHYLHGYVSVSRINSRTLALSHVVEDVDYVVVILETLDKGVDILLFFGRKLA